MHLTEIHSDSAHVEPLHSRESNGLGLLTGHCACTVLALFVLSLTAAPLTAGDAPALVAPPGQFVVKVFLTRFDQPRGMKGDSAPTRKNAVRIPGPNAVDWPTITVNGNPVFTQDSKEQIIVPKHNGGKFNSMFKVDGDTPVTPGDHWLRVVSWLFGHTVIYTVDRTARGSDDVSPPNYELFAFPVVIKGASGGQIQSVTLTSEGQTIYQRQETLDSLTLLLPAAKYELQVNGSAAQAFETGLEPIEPGNPRDVMLNVNLAFAGGITASLPSPSESFSDQKLWDADVAKMAASSPGGKAEVEHGPPPDPNAYAPVPMPHRPDPMAFVDVPISPIQIQGVAMSHGMSAGWFMGSEQGPSFNGDLEAYAAHLADMGYDQTFERERPHWETDHTRPLREEWLNVLAAHGIKGGIYPVTLTDANMALDFTGLSDYHGPKIRDIQLTVQRFAPYQNFRGIYFGGDNADYTRYWDWSPPKSRWAEALKNILPQFQKIPMGPEILKSQFPLQHQDTERNFLDFVAKYDQIWGAYGQLAHAATEILPDTIVTTGSFGSSPGSIPQGGWPAGTVPGQLMFNGMPVQTAYDWNELDTSLPMHLVALLDRLKSDHPETPTWAIVDDFRLLFGREGRQRAYALALTRGLTSIGGNSLAFGQAFKHEPPYKDAPPNPAIVDDYRDLHKWIHTYGGAYAGTKPDAKIGILYVNAQSLSRDVNNPPDKSPQEGKTTEALFICHAAGWPAKLVTPEELKRGLDPGITTLLLIGLNKIDDTWVWYNGLEESLQSFTARGGKILVDDESVSPLPATQTGMKVAPYLSERNSPPQPSPSVVLFERNQDNIAQLQKAMKGTPPPVAASSSQTIWAVPHTTGDVQYVTVVNWGYTDGTNADKTVLPQTGTLTWHSDRPIYDVRAGRLLSATEAATVDLTKDGFCLYALPPKPVGKPAVTVSGGMATVDVNGFKGVPVRLDVHANNKVFTVFAGSGIPAKLPLQTDAQNQVQGTELLSGQTSDLVDAGQAAAPVAPGPSLDNARVASFLSRKDVPVVVALTSDQAADAQMSALADHVVDILKGQGRQARVGRADPTDVVQSIQVIRSINPYPQWQTADTDLVLFGSPSNNVLIFDQVRGWLLPLQPANGQALVTYSPFVGGYQALNILGTDENSLSATVDKLVPAAGR